MAYKGQDARTPLRLKDLSGKFKVVFCFQDACPGYHKTGFPTLKDMVTQVKDNDHVEFMAIRTVFDSFEHSIFQKLRLFQINYWLRIPFGQDAGNHGASIAHAITDYGTGGTPWFLFINEMDEFIFSDFHLNKEAAVAFLKTKKPSL